MSGRVRENEDEDEDEDDDEGLTWLAFEDVQPPVDDSAMTEDSDIEEVPSLDDVLEAMKSDAIRRFSAILTNRHEQWLQERRTQARPTKYKKAGQGQSRRTLYRIAATQRENEAKLVRSGFGTDEQRVSWWATFCKPKSTEPAAAPSPALGGSVPTDVIDVDAGEDEVEIVAMPPAGEDDGDGIECEDVLGEVLSATSLDSTPTGAEDEDWEDEDEEDEGEQGKFAHLACSIKPTRADYPSSSPDAKPWSPAYDFYSKEEESTPSSSQER